MTSPFYVRHFYEIVTLSTQIVKGTFREGNGRTQRIFIEYLANNAGFAVDYSNVSADEMINASQRAFFSDYAPMEKIFERIVSKNK